MKKFALVLAIGFAAFSIPFSAAHADDSTSPTPTLYSDGESSQPTLGATNGQKPKGEGREHEVREEQHGLELLPISIVGGSLLIAIGLAVGISRRPH